ncbi:hypothetical protein quinque_011100 [Culex quinquefasciatus]
MNKIAIVSLALLALTKLTFGTIVPLKDGSGTQIGQLEDEIGDALLALVRLQGQFQGGLRDGQFKSSWLVARTVNETIEMLNTVANLTQTLLQHSQFQQYRTITSAIRIVHNTSTRVLTTLSGALKVCENLQKVIQALQLTKVTKEVSMINESTSVILDSLNFAVSTTNNLTQTNPERFGSSLKDLQAACSAMAISVTQLQIALWDVAIKGLTTDLNVRLELLTTMLAKNIIEVGANIGKVRGFLVQ